MCKIQDKQTGRQTDSQADRWKPFEALPSAYCDFPPCLLNNVSGIFLELINRRCWAPVSYFATIWCSVVQVQFEAVFWSAVQYRAVLFSLGQYCVVQFNFVEYSAMKCSSVQWGTFQWPSQIVESRLSPTNPGIKTVTNLGIKTVTNKILVTYNDRDTGTLATEILDTSVVHEILVVIVTRYV